MNANSVIQLWSCHSYTSGWFPHQNLRAGYNNFGQNMGMTLWAINTGNFVYNFPGHAFIETWYAMGTHSTFSRWNFPDNTCGASGRPNDICDYDEITVDVETNLGDSKYNVFRKLPTNLDKNVWDYINFSSGYRNNYWKDRGNVDIGGDGTYNVVCSGSGPSLYCYNNGSRSRSSNYFASYGYPNLSNVCSGYSAKLWNAYRPGNLSLLSHNVTPQDIYNVIK